MKVYKLDDDGVIMNVFANSEDEVRNMEDVKEYYEEGEYEIEQLNEEVTLTVDYDSVKITLTVKEWIAVRDIGTNVLSVSEY